MKESNFSIAQNFESRGNLRKAFSYYLKGSYLGDLYCRFNMAYCYDNGIGIRKNKKKAIFHYKICISNGDFAAAYNLSRIYKSKNNINLYEKYLNISFDLGDNDSALEIAKNKLKNNEFKEAKKYLEIILYKNHDQITESSFNEAKVIMSKLK